MVASQQTLMTHAAPFARSVRFEDLFESERRVDRGLFWSRSFPDSSYVVIREKRREVSRTSPLFLPLNPFFFLLLVVSSFLLQAGKDSGIPSQVRWVRYKQKFSRLPFLSI